MTDNQTMSFPSALLNGSCRCQHISVVAVVGIVAATEADMKDVDEMMLLRLLWHFCIRNNSVMCIRVIIKK